MTPVFVETSRALPIVSGVIAFRSGSTHDPAGREGLARITTRMLRRGAGELGSDAIEDRIDSLGAEFAADASLSTTSVHFEVIKRSVDPMVDLVATLLGKPRFDEAELGRLKRETHAEIIESRDSDRLLCGRGFRRTLFATHPYGRRVAGTLASAGAVTREDALAHYRRHFVRANAVVALSGDLSEAEGNAVAERLLAHLPEGEPVADPTPEPTAPAGRTLCFVDKPERTQTQMIVGGLGTDAHDPDHVALLVANTVFGGTFTSRLMQEIRAKRGWSYGASSRAGFDRRRDTFTMSTAPAAGDAAACLALEIELLGAWRDGGITAEELEFTKRYLVRSHAFEVDTARKRVHQRLEAALFDLPDGYHTRYVERVQAVTLDEANAAVRARIPWDDLIVSVVGTHGAIGDGLAKAIPGLGRVVVEPFDLE